MKKYILFVLIIGLVAFSCTLKNPTQPDIKGVTQGDLALTKMVAIGNSLTAGFQSAGLVEEYQLTSYPYQIAKQMGVADDFQQPLIADPGISSTPGVGVLDFNPATGAIEPRGTYTNPMALLRNALLPRPYDNLGVPGADLNDALNTVNGSGGNPFFDLILRNPNFGNTTMWQQAKLLKPTMVLLWIGNNDVLGAALDGGDSTQITNPQDFQNMFVELLTDLAGIRPAGQLAIIMANIPNVTDIPYVNILDNFIYKSIPALGINDPVPVVFDASFQPVLFDSTIGLYLPLLTAETDIKHVLLPFLSEYQSSGLGVPDSAALRGMGLSAQQARALVAGMVQAGLNPSGVSIPGNLTLTEAEVTKISGAVTGFNQIIGGIAQSQGIPLVDINALMNEINMTGVDGYSGKFVFFDPANTAFSLDGIHASSGGYALVANRFIEKINQVLGSSIPAINTAQYKGQYTGMNPTTISLEAAKQAKAIFTR